MSKTVWKLPEPGKQIPLKSGRSRQRKNKALKKLWIWKGRFQEEKQPWNKKGNPEIKKSRREIKKSKPEIKKSKS